MPAGAEYHRNYRAAHKEEKHEHNDRARKLKTKALLLAELGLSPVCQDCRGDFGDCLSVLEFDHRPDEPKTHGIARMIRYSYSWAAIITEAGRCDLVCANCHRRRTAARLQSG